MDGIGDEPVTVGLMLHLTWRTRITCDRREGVAPVLVIGAEPADCVISTAGIAPEDGDLIAAERLLAAVTAFHQDLLRQMGERAADEAVRPGWDADTVASQRVRAADRRITAVTGWNMSTVVVRAIRDRLRGRRNGAADESPAMWIVADGAGVGVGHHVALDLTPDTVGVVEGVHPTTGLPCVRITEGPGVGGLVYPYPGQILTRVHRPSPRNSGRVAGTARP